MKARLTARAGWAALLLLAALPAAGDVLSVGRKGYYTWTYLNSLSSNVVVNLDSIGNWRVAAGDNVCPGLWLRGGRLSLIAIEDGWGRVLPVSPMLAYAMLDGDPTTAFDPDQYEDVPRDAILVVDLGGLYRANRVRLFPRLDQEHRLRFPQDFSLATGARSNWDPRVSWEFWPVYERLLATSATLPNQEPVVDRRFESREARYLRLQMGAERPWEIAELEVYSDGTVPVGEYVSKPFQSLRTTLAAWGKFSYEDGDLADLPVTVQTRTGPDANPMLYFRLTGVGDAIEPVSWAQYSRLNPEEKGPSHPNPEWSTWENLEDGGVRSPPGAYLQFRLRFNEPGTKIRTLFIECTQPPIALQLGAEIDPAWVAPSRDTSFTLSLRMYKNPPGWDPRWKKGEISGFTQLQVLTPAVVDRVEQVLVDDAVVPHAVLYLPGKGFTVVLRRRVQEDGAFLQIRFRGAVYQDAARFEVRTLDQRGTGQVRERVSQLALEEDVDPRSPGGVLQVRLRRDRPEVSLIAGVAGPPVFTPNADRVNDRWELGYDLLNLRRPALVQVCVYDLSGRLVRRLYEGDESSGPHRHRWEGRDEDGQLVPPGHYLYRVRLEADRGTEERTGLVRVVR